jgi:putative phosphotransacetylase
MKVKLGVSNRHVHLTKEHLKILFDDNLEITRTLVQPGEFASDLLVTLKTEKDFIENVRVLGPTREYTQVEISKTDAYKLGLNPPVRESGDIAGSSPITLVGTKGEVSLEEGCIIATRHIHITPSDVKKYHLKRKNKVSVKVPGIKGGILHEVTLKVSEHYALELHLDTDDANAFLLKTSDELEIKK